MEKIEKLKDIIKKLEGVYKITIDPQQKERVKQELSNLKQQLKNLEAMPEEILTEEEDVEEVKKVADELSLKEKEGEKDSSDKTPDEIAFPLLSKISIDEKVHPASDDPEIDMAAVYLKKFEDDLWGALSDFHLKLDYNYSRERDKFYDHIENCRRLLKNYTDILDEITNTESEKYKERLRVMKVKIGRAFLITLTEFMKELNSFVNYLLTDYNSNGNIILNPDDIIKFSKLNGGNKEIDGMSVIDALKYVAQFSKEFIEKIKIPEEILSIKKNF